jgi:hypothetical protein
VTIFHCMQYQHFCTGHRSIKILLRQFYGHEIQGFSRKYNGPATALDLASSFERNDLGRMV